MSFGNLFSNYEEAVAMILFGIGFSNLLLQKNLIKKIIGLNIMDTATYLFLALKGYIDGRKAPVVVDGADRNCGLCVSDSVNVIADHSIVSTVSYSGFG